MDTVRTYISTLDGKQQLTLRPEATMKKAAGALSPYLQSLMRAVK